MRLARSLVASFVLVPAAVLAQPADKPLSRLEVQVACAPPTSFELPSQPLHVIGSQDPVARFVFSTVDLLVLDGGQGRGVERNQRYFIRRPIVAGTDRTHAASIQTVGWLSVVSVNDKTAIAKVDHFCDAITAGDYLEPFVAPSIPDGTDRDDPRGELDFSTLGRIVIGPENTNAGAAGSLMLIDPGENAALQPGARFAVYRDPHQSGMPLASVGEGVVLSVGKSMVLTKITRSRDAIVTGDYIVPRK